MTAALASRGVARVDGVLLDLGVSSPQLDEAARGFSFTRDGPLDMRMDPTQGEPAADWLARATAEEIRDVLRDLGEERFASSVARALVAEREREPIRTTQRLADIVSRAVRTREPGKHPATRAFQAIRMKVNDELGELEATLPQAVRLLAPGGRVAVISFHSLEDRAVKRYFQSQSQADALPRGVPVRARDLPEPRLRLVGRAIRAAERESAANPRARSATLRVAERTQAP